MFSSIFGGIRGNFPWFFYIVFQARTGKKHWGKIIEKITGPGNFMLNQTQIPICPFLGLHKKIKFNLEKCGRHFPKVRVTWSIRIIIITLN